MKSVKRILNSFTVILLICILHCSGSAYNGITQTGCTESAITLSWPAASYNKDTAELSGYRIEDEDGREIASVSGAHTTTATITGLSKGIVDVVFVYAVYSDDTDYYLGKAKVNTIPKNIASMDFVLDPDANKFDFTVSTSGATGIRVEKTVLSTGAKYYKNITTSYDTVNANVNVPYMLRAIPYYKNPDNGKTYFGKWTVEKYCVNPYLSVKSYSTTKGFDITLKKCVGVKCYRIYLSTSKKGNYVLSSTVTVTGETKSVHIEKMGSNTLSGGRYYYIKVLPVFYTNSGLAASHTPLYRSVYNWK